MEQEVYLVNLYLNPDSSRDPDKREYLVCGTEIHGVFSSYDKARDYVQSWIDDFDLKIVDRTVIDEVRLFKVISFGLVDFRTKNLESPFERYVKEAFGEWVDINRDEVYWQICKKYVA